jgi:hypothetical protein
VKPPGNAERPGNERSSPSRDIQPSQGRGDRGSETGAGNQTQAVGEEGRRKRSSARYVGWGDGINREYCDRMSHRLPTTFPVAAHNGAATIRATVVAIRPDAYLLCTYDHSGVHVWPGGDVESNEEADQVSGLRGQH